MSQAVTIFAYGDTMMAILLPVFIEQSPKNFFDHNQGTPNEAWQIALRISSWD
jgi:hypothetical protein